MLSIGVWDKIVQSAPKINRFPFKDFFSSYISFATSSELPSNITPLRYNPPIAGRLNNCSHACRLKV